MAGAGGYQGLPGPSTTYQDLPRGFRRAGISRTEAARTSKIEHASDSGAAGAGALGCFTRQPVNPSTPLITLRILGIGPVNPLGLLAFVEIEAEGIEKTLRFLRGVPLREPSTDPSTAGEARQKRGGTQGDLSFKLQIPSSNAQSDQAADRRLLACDRAGLWYDEFTIFAGRQCYCIFDSELCDRQDRYMKSRDAWARRVKRRLERAGFKVSLPDPALATERKRAGRLRDLKLLAQGKASPDHLQSANSIFGGRAKRFRILDYGGLNE